MNINNIGKIIIAVVVCQLVGVIGAVVTIPAIPGWYAGLNKPSFSPPNWLFGPAWITLYTLMGIAVALVWAKGLADKKVRQAMIFFGVQLFLNALWSILFFGWHQTYLAFFEIVIMLGFIALTTLRFYRIEKTAAYLMLPYLAWVSFASLLNFAIYLLNR